MAIGSDVAEIVLGSRLCEGHERNRVQYHKVNIYMMTLGELWKYCLPMDTSVFYGEIPFELFDCAVVHQLDQSFWSNESNRERYHLGKIFSSLGIPFMHFHIMDINI
jgi:hypothetical protein